MYWLSDSPKKVPLKGISEELAHDMMATHGISENIRVNTNGVSILFYSDIDTNLPKIKIKFNTEFRDVIIENNNRSTIIDIRIGDILDAFDVNGIEYIVIINSFPLLIPSHWAEIWTP